MASPEIIKNDDFCDNDYELEDDNNADKIPVTGPSAERPLGDDGFQAFLSREAHGTTEPFGTTRKG